MTRRTFIQSLVVGSGAIVFGAAVAVRAEPKKVIVENPKRFWMCSTPSDGPNWFYEEYVRLTHENVFKAMHVPAEYFEYPGRAKPNGSQP